MMASSSDSKLIVPPGTVLVPGKMYLRLFHGRTDPDQEMDDWGFAGPVFGPLAHYVMTYCCNLRLHAENGDGEIWLNVADDLIQWEGSYYGDMAVFIADAKDKA